MEQVFISPKDENQFVKKLLEKINSEFEPELVPVKIEKYSEQLNCFGNVDQEIELDGGKVHYGWAVGRPKNLCILSLMKNKCETLGII